MKILYFLLLSFALTSCSTFINAVNSFRDLRDRIHKEDVLSDKLIEILPKQYLGNDGYPEKDLYLRILQICEFIAGMTDSYAISLFRKLT